MPWRSSARSDRHAHSWDSIETFCIQMRGPMSVLQVPIQVNTIDIDTLRNSCRRKSSSSLVNTISYVLDSRFAKSDLNLSDMPMLKTGRISYS